MDPGPSAQGGQSFSLAAAAANLPLVAVRRRFSDDTDWEEMRELVTESYRTLAPKKLSALLDMLAHLPNDAIPAPERTQAATGSPDQP